MLFIIIINVIYHYRDIAAARPTNNVVYICIHYYFYHYIATPLADIDGMGGIAFIVWLFGAYTNLYAK